MNDKDFWAYVIQSPQRVQCIPILKDVVAFFTANPQAFCHEDYAQDATGCAVDEASPNAVRWCFWGRVRTTGIAFDAHAWLVPVLNEYVTRCARVHDGLAITHIVTLAKQVGLAGLLDVLTDFLRECERENGAHYRSITSDQSSAIP